MTARVLSAMARTRRARRALKWIATTLAAGIAAAGVFSFFRWPAWVWDTPTEHRSIALTDGGVAYEHLTKTVPFGGMVAWPGQITCMPRPPDVRRTPILKFYWTEHGVIGVGITTMIDVPLWAPLAPTAVPALFLWWRERRRFPAGSCPRCGYALVGVSGGTCPECGRSDPV